MSIIREHAYFTLLTIYEVRPERQDELVSLLERTAEEVTRNLPGFISSNIHRSLDGRRVIDYAQWRSQDYFESTKQNPLMKDAQKKAEFLAVKVEQIGSEVASTHEGDQLEPPPAPGFLSHYENDSAI